MSGIRFNSINTNSQINLQKRQNNHLSFGMSVKQKDIKDVGQVVGYTVVPACRFLATATNEFICGLMHISSSSGRNVISRCNVPTKTKENIAKVILNTVDFVVDVQKIKNGWKSIF